MNQNFEIISRGSLRILVYKPWWQAGIIHGMTLTPFSLQSERESESEEALKKTFDFDCLVIPDQFHGTQILDLEQIEALEKLVALNKSLLRCARADAILTPKKTKGADSKKIGYGVMTADCVPVLVKCDGQWLCIHAGWRGLADDIIGKSLALIQTPLAQCTAVVFPCAGAASYEVGGEVIEAIGWSADAIPQSNGKFMLNLSKTAANQLARHCSELTVATSDVCTISSSNFHSFRRDGEGSGRNITFVVPSLVREERSG